MPEGQIKEFLDKHLPEGEVLEAEVTNVEVGDAPDANDPQAIHEALQQAVLKNPDDEDARFDYVKLLLTRGQTDDAKVAFAPVIAKTGLVRRFDSLQRWMNAMDFAAERAELAASESDFDAKIAANKRDFDARFGKGFTTRLQSTFLNLRASNPKQAQILDLFGAKRFIPAPPRLYDPIEKVGREIGKIR